MIRSHRRLLVILGVSLIGQCAGFVLAQSPSTAPPRAPDEGGQAKIDALRANVNHVIIIYQENWSFDALFGKFPGANGVANAGDATNQVDRSGKPYETLPPARDTRRRNAPPDQRIPQNLPVGPFDLASYIGPAEKTGDLIHSFYPQQLQINGGKMNMFAAWTDAGGLVMSYFDATNLPQGKLAQEFTLCDNTFHAAYGGSFLNHFWLIAAATPVYPNAPASITTRTDANGRIVSLTSEVTPDGYAVNTLQPFYTPHEKGTAPAKLLPPQTMPTIGDRLSEKNITWAWYAGGWDDAMAGNPHEDFAFHHQPFVYFKNFADGTAAKKEHLRDEKDFLVALKNNALPSVSYIKANGPDDEHPSYASLAQGQQHVADLVAAVRNSPYWKDTVIIITYDENGGRWDHVAPPKPDRWGTGTRVPTIVISPFARRGYIDSTQYDSTSTLKLIELRWDLKPLATRDAATAGFLNSLEFPAKPNP